MRTRSNVAYAANPVYLGSTFVGFEPEVYETKHWGNLTNGIVENDWTCKDELHSGPPFKTGGPFDNFTYSTDQYEPKADVDVQNGMFHRKTKHVPYSGNLRSYLDPLPVDWGDVSTYGPTGWNRYRPTRPKVDLGVAAVELRDLPRMLKSTAESFTALFGKTPPRASKAGDAWLNTHFGWLPFISDCRKTVQTCFELDKRLEQLRRDNGKWVRRAGPVHSENNTEILIDTNDWGLYPSEYYYLNASQPPSGRQVLKRTDKQDVWFVGRFKYHIPSGNEFVFKAKAYSMLFGCVPSPSLLWELTPWSWLSDWCCNAGDCLEMLSSMLVEDLCAQYAYIMGHTIRRCDYYGAAHYVRNSPSGSWYAAYERKLRIPASHFGFGLTRDSFSSRQWSILGALGLSRL